MAKRVKVPFLQDRVIMIAWSRYNFHPHHTRCCVLE